jgi:hypothetical protein
MKQGHDAPPSLTPQKLVHNLTSNFLYVNTGLETINPNTHN